MQLEEITDVLQDSAQHGELLSADPAGLTLATAATVLFTWL